MSQKSVSKLIIEDFVARIKKDDRYKGVAESLSALMDMDKRSEQEMEKALRGKQDEDPRTGR
jgi:hypothetical protein